tara:strand:- start:594 stop:839 length:246 start_codon:yes stop_codon:yes gene_type:complete
LAVAVLDQVLTVVVAVALVVFKLTSQASFQDQLLVVPWHYLLQLIRLPLVEVGLALVQHQLVEIQILLILQETVKIQYLIV